MGLALYLLDWPTIVLQCFDTIGWVIWPVKIVPNITYNLFSGTLNPTLLLLLLLLLLWLKPWTTAAVSLYVCFSNVVIDWCSHFHSVLQTNMNEWINESHLYFMHFFFQFSVCDLLVHLISRSGIYACLFWSIYIKTAVAAGARFCWWGAWVQHWGWII